MDVALQPISRIVHRVQQANTAISQTISGMATELQDVSNKLQVGETNFSVVKKEIEEAMAGLSSRVQRLEQQSATSAQAASAGAHSVPVGLGEAQAAVAALQLKVGSMETALNDLLPEMANGIQPLREEMRGEMKAIDEKIWGCNRSQVSADVSLTRQWAELQALQAASQASDASLRSGVQDLYENLRQQIEQIRSIESTLSEVKATVDSVHLGFPPGFPAVSSDRADSPCRRLWPNSAGTARASSP